MRLPLIPPFAALAFAAASAFAQTPTFTVVNTGLDATFGNAGKAVLDPQVSGFTGVAFGNGLFVAIGASVRESVFRWATSPDGITWTGRSQAVPAGSQTFQQSKVHFLNGKFIFFTGYGDNASGSTWCYASADGLTWTGSKVADGRANVEEFDASPTLTVAAAHNGLQYASADLVTWTPRPVVAGASGFDHLDLAYSNGKFFSSINGFGGATYSSGDAVTWTAIPLLTAIGGSRVEAGNGFLVATVNATQYKSTDATNFTRLTLSVPAGWLAPGGTPRFTGAGFVAQAIDLGAGKSGYLVSADAVTWRPVGYLPDAPRPGTGFIARSYLYADLAYGNGKYVLVGADNSQAAFSIQNLPLVLAVDGSAPPPPAAIATQPKPQTISAGGTAVFSVTATGATSYQWKLNNAAIAGATGATLVVRSAAAANAGTYTVDAIGAGGTATSAGATLTLSTNPDFGRISNLSILTNITATEPLFTVGAVVGGAGTSGTKPLLVRAAGPALTQIGVQGVLADPKLDLYVGQTVAASNDNWGGTAALANAFAAVGAFAYASPTSLDAAIFNPAAAATAYTVQVSGGGGATGTVIAELYDATPGGAFTPTTPRLVNVSVLKTLAAGEILTAGFTIGGTTAKTVLVRVIGPRLALAPFNIGGAMADPKLDLYSGQTVIASNDNWGGNAQLTAVANAVNAFAVTDAASKDAMLLLTLAPGGYTAQASGVAGTGGIAIIEVYEVP